MKNEKRVVFRLNPGVGQEKETGIGCLCHTGHGFFHHFSYIIQFSQKLFFKVRDKVM